MTHIDAQTVSPPLSAVLRSLEGTTSRLSIWLKRDPNIRTSESSVSVHSHHGPFKASRSPIPLVSPWDSKSSTRSLELENDARKDSTVYFPTSRRERNKVFMVPKSHGRFESPISSLQRLLDSGPLANSIWLQDQAELSLQTHPASRHRSEIFVGCDTPVSPDHLPHATQQTRAQHSSSTPEPPFVFDPFGLEDSAAAGIFHGHDGIPSYARIPDSHLDCIVPRKDTAERQPSTVKETVLDEDRIRAWLKDVSKAMMDEDSSAAGFFHGHDGICSYDRIPDSHLDCIVPRKDTGERQPSTVKETVLDEDRIRAWLKDVSKAMMDEDSSAAGIFHGSDSIRSYTRIPDSHLDCIVPRKDTAERHPTTVKKTLLNEDRIRAWLQPLNNFCLLLSLSFSISP